MKSFENQYMVITGAAQGIGYAVASRMLQTDISGIAILDINENQVQRAASELDDTGKRVLGYLCDITDPNAVKQTFDAIYKKFGHVEILVNNAGITRDCMFHRMTEDQMRVVMEVNFFGTVNCIRAVVNDMRKQEYGRIINLSSTSTFGNPGQSNYAASKSAIDGLTRTLAKELAPKGITVNSILPSFVDTEMMRSIPHEIFERIKDSKPMKRAGKPEEIAALVVFLSSPESSYISGTNIICSGASMTIC